MNKFTAKYCEEALAQLYELAMPDYKKIVKAVAIFEEVGTDYKNINDLGESGLYELKPDNVRAYFKYHGNKIIIVGFVVLKKTQKTPKRYIEQALRNIENYIKENKL